MKHKGFTLIEVLVVTVIIGITATIASFSWQRYVANSNLRTGARQLAADFAMYKTRAMSEGRDYTITIHISPANNYDIFAPANALLFKPDLVLLLGVTPIEASRAKDAQITAVDFAGGSMITATQRGLVSPPAGGTITLTNSRNATAIVTINARGRVDVTFTGL